MNASDRDRSRRNFWDGAHPRYAAAWYGVPDRKLVARANPALMESGSARFLFMVASSGEPVSNAGSKVRGQASPENVLERFSQKYKSAIHDEDHEWGAAPMEYAHTLDWSPYASAYDRVLLRTATYQALITDLLGSTGPLPLLRDHAVILDCGCGTGNLCQSISNLLPKSTLVAVDRDPTMAEFFRRKLADRLSPVPKPGAVCLLEADLMAVFPWLVEHRLRPDYVFLVNVLYLVEDPAATLRMIAACLSPGGELRLSNPDEQTDLDALLRQLERDLAATQQLVGLATDFAVLGGFNHERLSSKLHRLSGAEICRLVRDAGFHRITHITHDHYAGQSLLLSAAV